MRWLLAVIAATLLASGASAEVLGRVVAVHDGDTISVSVAERVLRVRLHGIDAPERVQPFANASRHALESLVSGRDVRIVAHGHDGYGRLLGRVYAAGVDVNAEQVRLGHAWVFRRFVNEPLLLALEAEAKAAQRGLWRDPRAIPPWQWRARRALQPTSMPPVARERAMLAT